MLASVPTATLFGVDADPVTVEVHVSAGLPGFSLVGRPDACCREARDRVRAALVSCGLVWPNKRLTANLAPTSVRKAGSALDLAIAVAVLVASEQLAPEPVEGTAFLGELGLDGSVRPVVGIVPLAAAARGRRLVVPTAQVREARLTGREVLGVGHVGELVAALRGELPWPDDPPAAPAAAPVGLPDLADVSGQPTAREALELAAAGEHHLLLTGPPGGGKTMLAERLVGLLPDLTPDEALEVTKVRSAAGVLEPGRGLVVRPPYEAPHPTASAAALVGGGSSQIRPGAISLAHRGVLFLDELGEHRAAVLDTLRQPLEEGRIRIHRSIGTATLPARFVFVAAMNPCPCGGRAGRRACSCTAAERARYLRRLSGPLLDRFDLRLRVAQAAPDQLLDGPPGEPTAVVAERVGRARARAAARGVRANARIPGSRLEALAPMSPGARRLLRSQLERGALSGRGLHRVRRVALTVADLRGEDPPLTEDHVAIALELRAELTAMDLAS